MRDLFRSRVVAIPLIGLALLAAGARPSLAQTTPAEIARVVLVDSGASVDLRIAVDRSIEWKTVRGPDGNLVLELPGALPREGIADLLPPSGLIQSVVVRVASPGPEPPATTRITITRRAATAHSVLPSPDGLVVRFRPARLVPMPRDRYRVVADPCLNLRARASLDGRVLACLPRDIVVAAVGSRPSWRELRLPDGRRGWASDDYLDPVGGRVSSNRVSPAVPAVSRPTAPVATPRELGNPEGVLSAALADARSENRSLAAEVDRLRDRLEQLDEAAREASILPPETAPAADDRERLEAELARARSAADAQAEALSALRQERDEIAGTLAESERRGAALAESLAREQAARQAAQTAAAGLAGEADRQAGLESELEEALSAAAARVSELEATRRERDEIARRLASAESQHDELVQRLTRAESQRDELARRLAEVENERDELSRRLAGVERERDELTARLADVEGERDELAQNLAGVESERDELGQSLAAVERERDELTARLAARPEPAAAVTAAIAPPPPPAEPAQPSPSSTPPSTGSLLIPAEPLRWAPPEDESGSSEEVEPIRPVPPMAGIPPEPEPVPEPTPPASQVIAATVRDWASAWEDQRVDDYLGFYAPDFRPADGSARRDWEAQRRVRVGAPGFIEITLDGIRVTALDAEQAVARFSQTYRSDRFTDTVVKRLRLRRSEQGWKIAEEVVE